jgi:sedoheptulokinase
MTELLIGLDAGTTTLCAVALDARDGSLRAVEIVTNDAALPPCAPGAAEQDAAMIRDAEFKLLAQLTARPEVQGARFLSLGVTGQMHGVVLVPVNRDRASSESASSDHVDNAPVTPLISWRDARGNDLCASSGRSYADELAHRLGAAAVEHSGCTPASGYGGVTLLRLLEEGVLPPHATALSLPDFLVRALCHNRQHGVTAIGPDLAASWGIFDAANGNDWLPAARDALRLKDSPQRAALLPDVLPANDIAGTLSSQAARVTRLPSGLPVAVAPGDNQATFWGSVLAPTGAQISSGANSLSPGDAASDAAHWQRAMLLNLGTGGQMSLPVGEFRRVPGLETRPLVPGWWLLVGASLCGGRAYDVLRQFFAAVGSQLFDVAAASNGQSENGQADDALFERMNQLAAQVPDDCDGLTALPLFDGTRLDPAQRGQILGLNEHNFTPGHLSCAVIAGMVEELFGFYNAARGAGASARKVFGAGNAVRRNTVVRHEIERRFALSLHLPPHREEAAVGAALAGGIAIGALKLG